MKLLLQCVAGGVALSIYVMNVNDVPYVHQVGAAILAYLIYLKSKEYK